ncbi:helix-turn-helix domain-containing protein [Spirosoma endbachense]|uniref:PAS domain-containing protein n=1 Tax=Spirosoma endbachense TaxID=2666025 RepID=A0A6P1W434_9BACT|nr:AraC family transcriptional regulator [Spirosoma endbachense]QHV99318.1 PAS domain-containing protein [Spirosoma endbachense]
MKIYIRYMVSRRCKLVVQAILDQLGLQYLLVDLGEVELKAEMTADQRDQLKIALLIVGLELMDDKKAILIEKIKTLIIDMVHYADELPKTNNSDYISQKLNYDYTYLTNLFSQVTGTTIEHYIITQRIERVKELLLYDKLNLTQIADKLNYSSVAHLSNQFKKVTGLTTTFFKKLKRHHRLAQHDEVLLFDEFSKLFAWSLNGRQSHYYHRSIRRGCTMILTNPMHTILWASRSFLTMTGYKPIDVLGKTPHFLQGPGSDALTLRFIREQLNENQTLEADILNYRSNGESYICHLRIDPLHNQQGELTHFMAVEYDN